MMYALMRSITRFVRTDWWTSHYVQGASPSSVGCLPYSIVNLLLKLPSVLSARKCLEVRLGGSGAQKLCYQAFQLLSKASSNSPEGSWR